MKNIIQLTIICVLTFLTTSGQAQNRLYKKFTDTTFKVGDIIHAPNIIFYLSSCDVIPDSKDSVKIIADFIKKHPTFKIEIGSHTDSRGKAEMNKVLSECRARAVLFCLKYDFQTPDDKLTIKGYGSSELLILDPVIKNVSDKTKKEKLHQKNRRIEIKILGI